MRRLLVALFFFAGPAFDSTQLGRGLSVRCGRSGLKWRVGACRALYCRLRVAWRECALSGEGRRAAWLDDMIVDVGVGYCVDRVAGQAGPPWVT